MTNISVRDDIDSELIEALGLCGCGDHESAFDFVRGGLQLIADVKLGPHYTRNAGRFDPEFEKWCDDHSKREAAYFGSRGAMFFFYYWADDKGFTEHGGSVPGWLTEEGEAMLAKLTAICGHEP